MLPFINYGFPSIWSIYAFLNSFADLKKGGFGKNHKETELGQSNDLWNRYLGTSTLAQPATTAPALTDITFNFTFPNRRFNRKAPATPTHQKTGRSRSERAPGQSESEMGGRRAEEEMGGLGAIYFQVNSDLPIF